MNFPGIVIGALRGGSGKTIISVGIVSTFKKLGKKVLPFKKGPDYIDAGWLALAASRPCHNLDTFLINPQQVLSSFQSHIQSGDIAVVEGNRGLFDGIDPKGTTSTAELSKLLKLPVLLCIDCTKSTRTMAAVVRGCVQFDPSVSIKGVILNRIAGARHESILRRSIEEYCNIPVVGAVPKLKALNFPERHMGLVPTVEHGWAKDAIEMMTEITGKYVDLENILNIAHTHSRHQQPDDFKTTPSSVLRAAEPDAPPASIRSDAGQHFPKIGIIKDSAFQFYYPENINALSMAGAELVFISPLSGHSIPPLDGLYIGGGFPETHTELLARNKKFKKELKSLVEEGLPVYAECGGLMFLGEKLIIRKKAYSMAGILPIVFDLSKKPQGHGYTVLVVERENPYFGIGAEIKGHEFHYSRVVEWKGSSRDLAFSVKKGAGFQDHRDGLCYKNVLATYTHIHALGTPEWAKNFVHAADRFKQKKTGTGLTDLPPAKP